jgi:hypothetical protein
MSTTQLNSCVAFVLLSKADHLRMKKDGIDESKPRDKRVERAWFGFHYLI